MQFVPIHNHSEYSALDGLSTVREIADRCEQLGCPCCGLTDHNSVAGHLEFGPELEKRGIKPIYGCELYHGVKPRGFKGYARNERDQAHFVAGAMTDEGLRNLWRLVDAASKNFRYVGRVDWEMLEKFSQGVFATSACIQGLVPQGIENNDLTALDKYLEIFGDNFYIELHTYPGYEHETLNESLVQIGKERGLPFVYANDAHFAFPEQYNAHDTYVAMQTGQGVDTPLEDRKMWHPMALYMMDEHDIRQHLSYLPDSVVDEALSNTVELADRVDAKLPNIERHLPVFIPKDCPHVDKEYEASSAAKLFIDLVEQGIYERYGEDPTDKVWERAQTEMEVFLNAGLEHYFLQAWDFCRYCDKQDITRGPGRGSAAGALVAYALGITDVDPLHYGLIFERFYNAGREKGFPDIDNDFPVGDRKKIKQYLADRWGAENVRTIGNIVRMKPKAALDKTYGAYGVTWAEKEAVKKIVAQVPDLEILGSDSIGWEDDGAGKTVYVMDHVGLDITRYIKSLPQERQGVVDDWLDFVAIVCSRVSGYGVHASGVVVSDVPLDAELPCYWSASQDTQATQFPMTAVEARMFVKQDILGLRTLDTLQDWQNQVQAHGITVEWSGLEREEHPVEMWETLDKGQTLGIFQIEGGYARKLCEEFKPRSVEDLSIIVALNRPGPIRSGAPDSFVRRRRGEEPIEYDHPILEDILNETYGWFLYQEQVIAFFSKLGYNLSEADAVRKILGKKKPEEMRALRDGIGEWEGKGYFDMWKRTVGNKIGVQRVDSVSQVIWNKLEDFAKYSFNKSHSVAYATIAFRTLYAKFNAPAEFIMACIRTNKDDAGDYVAEGRRIGVPVLPPEINRSGPEVAISQGRIYFGLSNVKGVASAGKYIAELRKTHDVSTPDKLRGAVEIETKAWQERQAKSKYDGNPFKEKSPKTRCKSNVIGNLERAGAFDNYIERSLTLSEMQKNERELLGVILSDNCEEAFQNNSDLIAECDEYEDILTTDSLMSARLPGVITNIRETQTRAAGKDMGIVTVEWESRDVEFVVFPQQWNTYKFLFKERTPVIVTLRRTERGINFEEGMKLT